MAKCSWIPKELSDDSYNFSLYGTCPMEEYYYLREYLSNHSAPQVLIYSQQITHMINAEAFWSRSVYFHRMSKDDLQDLEREIRLYDESPIFEGKNFKTEEFLYQTFSPVKYSEAFFKGMLSGKRYQKNRHEYLALNRSKGQTYFGTAEYCDDIFDAAAEMKNFKADEILDVYFRKIIELCEENNIRFIFQSSPFNKSTYEVLSGAMVSDYLTYMDSIQSDYPDAVINADIFYYDNEYFGDMVHLNERGAVKYSREMRKKYKDIFEG